ncbi:MAG TPA: hypothetical protein VKV40_06375 [Ktedonobacteraceae bacterium]|nr:hypothetical protein [Ktedonobacteraceae bacterium]
MEIDEKRQEKAREYARIRLRLSLVDMALAAVGVIVILASGLGIWFAHVLRPLSWQPIGGWFPLQILVYFLVLILGYQLLTTPLGYYSGYVLPHSQLAKFAVVPPPIQTVRDSLLDRP